MQINTSIINESQKAVGQEHDRKFNFLKDQLEARNVNMCSVITQLQQFQVAIPSWALGAGGTRFGRFSFGGEPGNLEQKIQDVGIVNSLTRNAGSISLHIPWDVPEDYQAVKQIASEVGISFDAINSNTFQDQPGQEHSYKFGSLSHIDDRIRNQAIEHNLRVIEIGNNLGSKALTVWLADGSSFPGQHNFRKAYQFAESSLQEIYNNMPSDWKLYIEYKPYEPSFYSMVIPDWGTSLSLAEACGENAHTLVDLGHHLPNTNIEQIVALLMLKGRLGGFHFNDSKYGDDDLTVGNNKPYQLFLIFNELVEGMSNLQTNNPPLAWMIDASHNLKDPLEDLIQSIDAITIAYAQALLVDRKALGIAQAENDVTTSQEILQQIFRTDVRPLVAEARRQSGGAIEPIKMYRQLEVRKKLIQNRGNTVVATGL